MLHRVDARLLVMTAVLLVALPAPARADDDDDRRWGVTLWGLSYHVNKSIDYAASNWGAGLRFYVYPRWLFVEADALRNSNRGLVVPVSVGLEVGIVRIGCKVSALGAFTAAYYQSPRKDVSEIKMGPVPGVSIGCGRVKTNVVAVLSKSDHPLAAIAASWTILF